MKTLLLVIIEQILINRGIHANNVGKKRFADQVKFRSTPSRSLIKMISANRALSFIYKTKIFAKKQ
ncbi:hypothetical protein T4D_7834 [Trichinella pseudospiralis]|uniref:PiggyBac transposable element-derived protein domain-containing protein n=1 Tax=Trichinella pseudospiralis TaxID=6337 RepID=A0A0V1FGM5_TRIPS|nr:hypothetical protein T4D_7834 [Trichinella pseudospiralis]